jgi:hypothetical protein
MTEAALSTDPDAALGKLTVEDVSLWSMFHQVDADVTAGFLIQNVVHATCIYRGCAIIDESTRSDLFQMYRAPLCVLRKSPSLQERAFVCP